MTSFAGVLIVVAFVFSNSAAFAAGSSSGVVAGAAGSEAPSQATPGAGSPEAATVFVDDLAAIVERAPSVQAAVERHRASEQQLRAKTGAFTPSLSAGIGRQVTRGEGLILSPDGDFNYWRADASWNLFRGGGDWFAREAAGFTEKAQELSLEDTRQKTEYGAANVVFHHLYLVEVLRATKELVGLRTESERIVREKYRRGSSPAQEVAKAEIDHSQQVIRLRKLETEALETRAQWQALLGRELRAVAWPVGRETKLPLPTAESITPELRSLDAFSAAAEHSWKASRGGHWPTLDLTAGLQEFPIVERTSRQWTTSLLLTIPIWSRFETSAAIASARAEWVQSQSRYEEKRRSEAAENAVLSERLELARQNLADSFTDLEKARKLYQDMLKGFRFGRLSMNELLIEQNRLIESELNVAQGQWDFHRVLMEGCAKVGVGVRECLARGTPGG